MFTALYLLLVVIVGHSYGFVEHPFQKSKGNQLFKGFPLWQTHSKAWFDFGRRMWMPTVDASGMPTFVPLGRSNELSVYRIAAPLLRCGLTQTKRKATRQD